MPLGCAPRFEPRSGGPAVHDVSRDATERRRPAGTAGSRFESVAAGMAGSRRWATRAPPRSDEAGLMY